MVGVRAARILLGVALLAAACSTSAANPEATSPSASPSASATPLRRTDCSVHDLLAAAPGPADEAFDALFPLPEDLKPAYDFWRQIYGNWTYNEAILHTDRGFQIKTHKNGVPEVYDGESTFVIQYSNRAAAFRAHRKGQAEYWRMQRGQRDKLEPAFGFWLAHQDAFDAAFTAEGVHEVGSALGFIESMFMTDAVSATGALGVFQIQPWEGHKLDAHVDAAYNELWDPDRAARLAARKLERDADALRARADAQGVPADQSAWPLALLSYNQGVNSMGRAVDELKTLDVQTVIEKHRGREYGFAGRNFYVQFRLFADLVRAAKREHCVAPDPPAPTAPFELDAWVTLGDLVACCGLDREPLIELNPGLTDLARADLARLPSGLTLRVPASSIDAVRAAWASPDHAAIKHSEQLPFAGYRIKRGQNLTTVAHKTGTSLFALLAENEMDVESANRIQPGAIVRIPTLLFAQLAARSNQYDPQPQAFDLHNVRPGESTRSIEIRYGLAAGELEKWNDVEGLQAGQTLAIPVYP